MVTMKQKECNTCNETKDLDLFYNHKISPDGKYSHCIRCSAIAKKMSLYNITREKVLELEEINECGVCKKDLTFEKHCIDHNHKTRSIRGVLCTNCNMGLGHFKDKVELLYAAVNYLENK